MIQSRCSHLNFRKRKKITFLIFLVEKGLFGHIHINTANFNLHSTRENVKYNYSVKPKVVELAVPLMYSYSIMTINQRQLIILNTIKQSSKALI